MRAPPTDLSIGQKPEKSDEMGGFNKRKKEQAAAGDGRG
jgi:hypothetical protein